MYLLQDSSKTHDLFCPYSKFCHLYFNEHKCECRQAVYTNMRTRHNTPCVIRTALSGTQNTKTTGIHRILQDTTPKFLQITLSNNYISNAIIMVELHGRIIINCIGFPRIFAGSGPSWPFRRAELTLTTSSNHFIITDYTQTEQFT